MSYRAYWFDEAYIAGHVKRHKRIRKKRMKEALDPSNVATLRDVQALGPLNGQRFMENVKVCFPVFIQLVSEGVSVSDIARLFGMTRPQLRNILVRYEPLRDAYYKAKKLARDKRAERITLD